MRTKEQRQDQRLWQSLYRDAYNTLPEPRKKHVGYKGAVYWRDKAWLFPDGSRYDEECSDSLLKQRNKCRLEFGLQKKAEIMKSDLKKAISILCRLPIQMQHRALMVALHRTLRMIDRAREIKAKGTK